MFFLSEGFTFRNFLTDVFAVFMFVLWFWLLIIVIGDLFRRHDISGWGKAIWLIALIVFPYIAIFAYMITQSRGMAERSSQQSQQAREELRRVVGFSVADEIEKLYRLKNRDRSPIRSSLDCAPSLLPRISGDTSSSKKFYTC
jgi:membrane protein implicated in regulation of membrane protease activity